MTIAEPADDAVALSSFLRSSRKNAKRKSGAPPSSWPTPFVLYGMCPVVTADDRLEHAGPGRLVNRKLLEASLCRGGRCGIAVGASATGVLRLRVFSAQKLLIEWHGPLQVMPARCGRRPNKGGIQGVERGEGFRTRALWKSAMLPVPATSSAGGIASHNSPPSARDGRPVWSVKMKCWTTRSLGYAIVRRE